MNNSKVWLVLGAANGLGYAAVRYLVANNQFVIACTEHNRNAFSNIIDPRGRLRVLSADMSDLPQVRNALTSGAGGLLPLDYIINNSNYGLFSECCDKAPAQLKSGISDAVAATTELITALLPHLRKVPRGSIINIPPQLCLASIPDRADAEKLAWGMDSFLGSLEAALSPFTDRITFLQPGERLGEFAV